MKDRHCARDSSRLAAVRKSRPSTSSPAGGRVAAGRRVRRPADVSPQEGEFVPQHDDFQLLEIVRPNVQGSEL